MVNKDFHNGELKALKKPTIELLHKHTLLAKTWAQLHKTVSKLGRPVSNKTLVKLLRRLSEEYFNTFIVTGTKFILITTIVTIIIIIIWIIIIHNIINLIIITLDNVFGAVI